MLNEACRDEEISGVDVFTLNYDVVLEHHFQNITFIDGFSVPDKNIRYWDPGLYESSQSKLRLFKLHGSINWHRLRTMGMDWFDEFIGIPCDTKFWEWKDKQGRPLSDTDGRRQILVGRFNKIMQYQEMDIFAELQCFFLRFLQKSSFLVVSGYGFGDRTVNTRIIEWVYSRPRGQNRVIIVHPEPEILKRTAGAVQNHWDNWKGLNNLRLIEKKIEQTSWAEIKEVLFNDLQS